MLTVRLPRMPPNLLPPPPPANTKRSANAELMLAHHFANFNPELVQRFVFATPPPPISCSFLPPPPPPYRAL